MGKGNCNAILQGEQEFSNVRIHWNSRSHRKRRAHPVSCDGQQKVKRKQAIRYYACQWSNLSWWVPFLFTLGSLVWLLNGCLSMWPVFDKSYDVELLAWTAFIGGLIFVFGAYSAILEVINRPSHVHVRPSGQERTKQEFFYAHPSHDACDYRPQPERLILSKIEWKNWGWWLNAFQLMGALIFFISCFTGVFLLYSKVFLERFTWFWLPQMVGAVFFMLSSIMAMIEVQDKWYLPAFDKIGWLSAFFNLMGAIGFYLCAYYGAYYQQQSIIYWGSDFSTFWGSVAFLISSYLMLLEVINP